MIDPRLADAGLDSEDLGYLSYPSDDDIAAEAGESQRLRDQFRQRRTFQVVTGDYLHEASSRTGLTAEMVIAGEVRHFDGSEDRAVWRGDRFIALIRAGADGKPVVWRP